MTIETLPYITRLKSWVESRDFAGWDPYDAMNSPLVRLLSLGTKYGRIAWTQFFRKCPINLRPLLAVPKRKNAKALGLFLEAYSKLYSVGGDEDLRDVIEKVLEGLDQTRSRGGSGYCWGYPFEWQSRAALVPAGTPTIVNSSFIGHALLDCHQATGSSRAREMALQIPEFMLRDLNRLETDAGFCFSYTPIDRNFVHNANMLGASLLMRLGKATANVEWMEVARKSMTYSVTRQRPDGSWPYAETGFQGWIDSFHTGFNLEALRWFVRLGEAPPEWEEAYLKGVAFYAGNFFLDDGTPKYYHDRVYPIDIHAPCEAVYFLSGESGHKELTDMVLGWMLRNMWNERAGCFHFRKSRYFTNRIPYMRWSPACGMRALVEYHVKHCS